MALWLAVYALVPVAPGHAADAEAAPDAPPDIAADLGRLFSWIDRNLTEAINAAQIDSPPAASETPAATPQPAPQTAAPAVPEPEPAPQQAAAPAAPAAPPPPERVYRPTTEPLVLTAPLPDAPKAAASAPSGLLVDTPSAP